MDPRLRGDDVLNFAERKTVFAALPRKLHGAAKSA
jgi:hypothetical protein